jgi:Mn-dependent DtxR family transcriptional regulator
MGRIIKDPKKQELIIKGFANYRRISILHLLGSNKGSFSNDEIAEELHIGFRSASQHLDKMYRAGLVSKTHSGPLVLHRLTSRGQQVIEFLRWFERY